MLIAYIVNTIKSNLDINYIVSAGKVKPARYHLSLNTRCLPRGGDKSAYPSNIERTFHSISGSLEETRSIVERGEDDSSPRAPPPHPLASITLSLTLQYQQTLRGQCHNTPPDLHSLYTNTITVMG